MYALDPSRTISQYVHSRWGSEQGFPGGSVQAFAQTADGYLWIGAEAGLIRFDGLTFTFVRNPDPVGFQADHVSFSLQEDRKEIFPTVRDEVYRIGYEAIRNACSHSGGSQLHVELNYARDLTLRVMDNGKGIDPDVAARGREGHFGLPGMQDRARRIGGKFSLVSSAHAGTEVAVIVPGSIAFRENRPSRRPTRAGDR